MTVQLDRYKVHALIARGGMADVLLASPLDAISVAELVAIKQIRSEFSEDPSFVQMFLDEARITRELNHPNVACLLDWGEVRGIPYLVMEFVAGVDLALVLKKRAIPPHLAIEVTAAVARALHHAHEKENTDGEPLGIVHRDVTPHNVMVTFEGEVKLLDFGIALARVRAERTRTGILKGKWSYMSPEQIAGRKVDRRSDIFSLGVLLYEMVTGRRAFAGESPTDILTAVALREPPPLPSQQPAVTPELEEIVNKCLRKEPLGRFKTALEVAESLEVLTMTAPPVDLTLSDFIVELFPTRSAQIKTVLENIETSFKPREEFEEIGGSTQIEEVPFSRVSADLEPHEGDADFGRSQSSPPAEPPPQGFVTDAMDTSPPFGVQPVNASGVRSDTEPSAGVGDVEDEDSREDSGDDASWTTVLAILLGLALGLGLVIAIWILASPALH